MTSSGCSFSSPLRRFINAVVTRVGDLGRIENVIKIFVVANLFAQLINLLFSSAGGSHILFASKTRWED